MSHVAGSIAPAPETLYDAELARARASLAASRESFFASADELSASIARMRAFNTTDPRGIAAERQYRRQNRLSAAWTIGVCLVVLGYVLAAITFYPVGR